MPMEVLALVMHFIITLCILGGYVFSSWSGHPDDTLKSLLLIVGGYWFSAIGKQVFSPSKTPSDSQPQPGPKEGPPNA